MSAQKEGTAKTAKEVLIKYCSQRGFDNNDIDTGEALGAMEEYAEQFQASQSPAAGVKGGNESLYPLWVRASERVPEENRKVYARKVDNKNYTLLLTWYRESQEFGEYGANYWYKKNEIEWLDESPSGQEQGQAADRKQLIDFFVWFRNNGELHIGKSVEKMIDEYLKNEKV